MNRDLLDPVIEGYLDYLTDVRRQTKRTVIDVRCTLRRVSEDMASRHPGAPLWKLRLEEYLHWLEDQRLAGRTATCLSKYLSHLRGLLDYAWRSGRSDRNVLDGLQIQDARQLHEPEALTLDEARRLVENCPKSTATERQERCILLVLYGCGLRTNELCQLDTTDINRERQELLVVQGKGDRQRVVPIPDTVFVELLAYLLERGGRRGPLFRGPVKHRRVTARTVCDIVARAAQRAGLSRPVTPKTLRHTYATHLMDKKVDLPVIASLMGHRSPRETGVYLHVLGDGARRAVNNLRKREGGPNQ